MKLKQVLPSHFAPELVNIMTFQDVMKNSQGCATIPISSLTDNPNERVRWWPIYHSDHECVGKVLLSIGSTFTSDETVLMKSGSIVETLAYDLLLEAAMRAQQFHARNLCIDGPWKWILTEFAEYYGVSDSYTKLRYLSYVMNVATPTKDCLEILHEFLVPVLKARSERNLTRQERTILLDCETQVERLLAEVFQNYKSLDENSPTSLADMSAPTSETAQRALAPAVQLYTLLHDILAQDAQTMLRNYLKTAATKRCRKHMLETDEFVSGNSEGFVMESDTITKAYLKMKNLCINLSNEIQTDIKIHNQHIFPSSIDLSSITSAVYSTKLSKRLGCVLAAWPPSSPMPHVNDLIIAMSDFERSLELWNISPVQGGVDSRDLYHDYIMVWIQDLLLTLLDLCKAEKVPWSGVFTKYSTSPFPEEMFEKMARMLSEYEVVINQWPQYTPVLENRGIVHVTKRKKEIDAMIEKILSGKFVKDHRPVPPFGYKDDGPSAREATDPSASPSSVQKKSKQPSVQADVQSSDSDTSEDGDVFHSDSDGDDNMTASSKSSIPNDADKTSTEA